MDVANVLLRSLNSASTKLVPALTNVWTMINNNPQAANIATAAIASQYAPGSVITGTGTILVGFAKLTAKIMIGFLVAVALYLVAFYGLELSGTSVEAIKENIKEKLVDVKIEKLWEITNATVIKLVNTTQEIVTTFSNNPSVQKLNVQFRQFINKTKQSLSNKVAEVKDKGLFARQAIKSKSRPGATEIVSTMEFERDIGNNDENDSDESNESDEESEEEVFRAPSASRSQLRKLRSARN